jgi:hypothetical protein
MPAHNRAGRQEVPLPVVIAALVVVVVIIAFVAYRQLAPPPDPTAGLTLDQQVRKMREAREQARRIEGGAPTDGRRRGMFGGDR